MKTENKTKNTFISNALKYLILIFAFLFAGISVNQENTKAVDYIGDHNEYLGFYKEELDKEEGCVILEAQIKKLLVLHGGIHEVYLGSTQIHDNILGKVNLRISLCSDGTFKVRDIEGVPYDLGTMNDDALKNLAEGKTDTFSVTVSVWMAGGGSGGNEASVSVSLPFWDRPDISISGATTCSDFTCSAGISVSSPNSIDEVCYSWTNDGIHLYGWDNSGCYYDPSGVNSRIYMTSLGDGTSHTLYTHGECRTDSIGLFVTARDEYGNIHYSWVDFTFRYCEAKIGSTYYRYLSSAISAVGNSSTVTVLMDLPNFNETINSSKNFKLNVNGKTLTVCPTCTVGLIVEGKVEIYGNGIIVTNTLNAFQAIEVKSGGTLTMKGTDIDAGPDYKKTGIKNAGTTTLNSDVQITGTVGVNNLGTLTVDGANINVIGNAVYNSSSSSTVTVKSGSVTSNYVAVSGGAHGIYNNGGTVKVEGGEVRNNADVSDSYAINTNGGTVTVSGGTVFGRIGVNGTTSAKLVVTGGTIEGDGGDAVHFDGSSTRVEVSGGTLYDDENDALSMSSGTAVLSGGTFTGDSAVINYSGNVTISGGTYTGANDQYKTVYNTGTLTVSGGTIQGEDSTDGIHNLGTTTVSGTAVIYGSDDAIENEGGTLYIKGGTLNASYGVYNIVNGVMTMSGGTINASYTGILGSDSKTITMTGGTINGGTYGISAGGTIKVQKGIIKASEYGISSSGNVTVGSNSYILDWDNSPLTNSALLIQADEYPVYLTDTSKTFNFYNGYLYSSRGYMSTTASHVDYQNSYGYYYQDSYSAFYYHAKIGSNYYPSIQKAIAQSTSSSDCEYIYYWGYYDYEILTVASN